MGQLRFLLVVLFFSTKKSPIEAEPIYLRKIAVHCILYITLSGIMRNLAEE